MGSQEEIVTVIVVRRDGSSYVDSNVLVKDSMFEGVKAWLNNTTRGCELQ